MKISKIRGAMYSTAKFLGDVNAVKKGRVKERLFNRVIGRLLSRIFKRK